METTQTRSFVRTVLPWLLGAAMLLLYLVTLNKVVTLQSYWPLARATGLDWHSTFSAPLTYLVTLPIRWLPSGIQLFTLNFTAALCAALSLALLARSVAILPHDRTQLQRDRAIDANAFPSIKLAWVPVVLAVLVAGLQRSFWEHALVGTGEALDLLLFAYCVRCLLEYRLEEKDSWLYKLAVVYAVGITNNAAMIGFLPILLIALAWVKGLRFFRFDFLARMFLFALAGLSLYLLLPLVEDHTGVTFWQALKTNLVWQKRLLWDVRSVALFPAVYALVPLLLMGIKWSGNFGDQSPIGNLFAKIAAIVLHAGLLALWLYVAFDPPVSPREAAVRAQEVYGVSFVFLPCYFLAALIVGYYSGFLLLVFSGTDGRLRRRGTIPPVVNFAVTALTCGGALFVAGKLFYDNHRAIRQTQSRAFQTYAEGQAKSLPESAVILSDDVGRLHALGAALGRAARDKYILLESRSLTEPAYHRFLRKRYGDRMPQLTLQSDYTLFTPMQILQLLSDLNQKYPLTYLQPSFGYFFESYYLEPHKLVYILRPYPTNAVEAPPPGAQVITRQQDFWKSLESGPFQELKSDLVALPTERLLRQKFTSAYVAGLYSRSLDHWGVDLQRANRFEDAFPVFEQALALNPDNASALINRDFNALWRKEGKGLAAMSKELQEKLNLYSGMEALLMSCGPIDEPSFSREFAGYFVQLGLHRQAQQMLLRGLTFTPGDVSLQAELANVYLVSQQPDRALTMLKSIPTPPAANHPAHVEIARIEAWAYYEKDDFPAAKRTMEKAVADFPQVDAAYNGLAQLHLNYAEKLRAAGRTAEAQAEMTNALKVVERQLRLQPNNPTAHFNHGNCCIFVGDYDCAIQSFTRVLEQQKENGAALLNRAIANFRAGKRGAARQDYEEVLRRFTTTNYQVYYGLAEIAYSEEDWDAAEEYYEKYLRYAPASLAGERKHMRSRLDEVKGK
ncbi:MAG TPA: tetratricopeptide repeat protein [Methylomirabilota bacterium]|nr:tetratricopeptide repeat protein [Methylomirabilota bacterium]